LTPPSRKTSWLAVVGPAFLTTLTALVACQFSVPWLADPVPAALATGTAFPPQQATVTPDVLRISIAPELPSSLAQSARSIDQLEGRTVKWVGEGESADISLGADPTVPVAGWVYALVAPFPTIEDEVSLATLQSAWSGASAPWPVFVTAEDLPTLSWLLGDPSSDVIIVEPDVLTDQTWDARPAVALVPFDDLDPRWKVLSVDGQSPLRADLKIDDYPLAVMFGVRGDGSDAAALAAALDEADAEGRLRWPASNRLPDRMTTVVMTGVTALTRATAWRMEGKGLTYPAGDIGDWLRQADFTHISNEVSFAEDCPPPDPGQPKLRFCSAPSYIALLDDVGTDLVEMTGNHVLDWGPQAFLATLDMYRQRGWGVFGGGENLEASLEPVRVEHNGNRLAFLGCNQPGPNFALASASAPGATPCFDGRVFETAAQLRAEGYLPIFTFQWAESDRYAPLPNQVEGFRQAVDAGAAIVSGSQAHQPQGFEFYQDGFIHYGPGNLFFDQMDRYENRQEFIVRYVFHDGRHISTELLTALLEDYARPRPMTIDERRAFLATIFAASGW
jgi:hypothetical protein